jgi:hypothetical protein
VTSLVSWAGIPVHRHDVSSKLEDNCDYVPDVIVM